MIRKVLLQATTRAGGDLNPVVALALGMRTAGYAITVLCDPASAPIFARFDFPTIISGAEYEVGDTVKAALQASEGAGLDERAAAVDTAIEGWRRRLAATAAGLLVTTQPDLIVTSLFGTCIGSELVRMSGKPWVAVNSTYYIGPNPPRPMDRDFSARATDIFRYSVIPYLPEAALVLHATDAWFDYDHRGIPANHHYIGPLFWEAPGIVPSYIYTEGEPWTLCTLSSHRQDDTPIARDAMQAIAHSHHRLAVTVGLGHLPEELAPIPANSHVEQYIPHSAVLGKSLLFVSHAGHGSVMKSLLYGVPMVLVPWSRDQFGVAARASSMRAARVLPRESLSIHAMAEAIDAVLHDPEYKWAAQAAAVRLQAERPLEVALELIAGVV